MALNAMSGFTATGTATPQPPIQGDAFWPALEPDIIRQHMRLDASVSTARLRHAILTAALSVNGELALWAAPYRARGIARLSDIPAPQLDGKTRYELLYQRAVACATAAELTERYRSFDATNSGHQHADALTPSIDELRRDARWAIRDIKGQTRTTVELI